MNVAPTWPPGLVRLHLELAWPKPADVLDPPGAGAAVLVGLAREKVGRALERLIGTDMVRVGVLVDDAGTSQTAEPLAIVCEFARPVSADTLYEAHRLAWNFCHAPVLVTVDPVEVRTWSCFVAPTSVMGHIDSSGAELPAIRGDASSPTSLADQACRALLWLDIASGRLVASNLASFEARGRVDRMLLDNLKVVRRRLITGPDALDPDLAHDLIARLMFVQFLFDRKDTAGASALDGAGLLALRDASTLAGTHDGLPSVLRDYDDAYRLFRWLNDRFNGDFFPAKSADPVEREMEWRAETDRVRPIHLVLLADLVGGVLDVGSGQTTLWRLYAFDVIPLEFVSSIYEEFVSAPATAAPSSTGSDAGVHYTPTHLVDFVLDGVLPWDGDRWDLCILDPACGSGVFLVRAFQRLVHRWRRAHPGRVVPAGLLAELLETRLFGVDVNPHAARVASFSLYLAMCDAIDPRRYWTEVTFPSLRDRRILSADFFREDLPAIATVAAEGTFDLVIGNAPWGSKTLSDAAKAWAVANDWPVQRRDVGVLFVAKGLALVRDGGRVGMVQSAASLLTNRNSVKVRRRLFGIARVDEIVNYTLLRAYLFPTAVSPACSVVLTRGEPDGRGTSYMCPKRLGTGEDPHRIVIDQVDVHDVLHDEVDDPWVWTVLMAGSRRDLELLRRIRGAGSSLRSLMGAGHVEAQEGVIPVAAAPAHELLRDRRILFHGDFPAGTHLILDANALGRSAEIRPHRKTLASVFDLPQLIVKQSWTLATRRLKAVVVADASASGRGPGVVCSQSYVSAHALTGAGERGLLAACLALNSRLTSYYVALTNGRMPFNQELRANDIYDLPFHANADAVFEPGLGCAELDEIVERLHALKEPDVALVEDAILYAVPELLGLSGAPGRALTSRGDDDDPATGTLRRYCEQFLRVLDGAAPPGGRQCTATVFEEAEGRLLPLRLVAIHLGTFGPSRIDVQLVGPGLLQDRLTSLSRGLIGDGVGHAGSVGRVGTAYDITIDRTTGARIPTIYMLRPDQVRYWTRTAALRDADRLVAEGLLAGVFADPTTDEASFG